jgi:TonB family protein
VDPLLAPIARGALVIAAALFASATTGAAQAGVAPPEEPPLSAVLDSAGLVRAVAALSLPALPPGALPLFQVGFDSTGAVKVVEPVFSNLPDSLADRRLPPGYADAVVAAIRAHLKPQAPSRRPLYTRLRVVAGPEPRVDRPALRERQPVIRGRATLIQRLMAVVQEYARERGGLPRASYEMMLRFRVLEDGTADLPSVVVERSTGDTELDRRVVARAGDLRFSPATVEEIPVKVWVALPLVLGVPPEAMGASLLVDSAGLARAVAGLAMPALPQGVRPLFRVEYDSTGAVRDVEPVFREIPAEYAGPVVAALRAHLKPQGASNRPQPSFLRVVAGPEPAVDRPTVVVKTPELANTQEIDGMKREAVRRFRIRDREVTTLSGGRYRVPEVRVVRLVVLADGSVDPESVQVTTPGDNPELDAELVRIGRAMRFQPPQVDGVPVNMRILKGIVF